MKVLIVDTDWRFAHQAVNFLEARAHHVVLQPNASEAFEQTLHWKPDLVIVAAELGDNGLIESLHDLPQRPAVLLTGWMDKYDAVWRAWQQGGDELFMKPMLRIDELHESIVTAMENAAAGTSEERTAARVSA